MGIDILVENFADWLRAGKFAGFTSEIPQIFEAGVLFNFDLSILHVMYTWTYYCVHAKLGLNTWWDYLMIHLNPNLF